MVWRDADDIARAAAAGHDVIAAPARHTYLDHGMETGPQAPVTIDAPMTMNDVAGLHDVLAAVNSSHLLGGQFQLWTGNPARPLSELEAQTRRLTAMGVNWHR